MGWDGELACLISVCGSGFISSDHGCKAGMGSLAFGEAAGEGFIQGRSRSTGGWLFGLFGFGALGPLADLIHVTFGGSH